MSASIYSRTLYRNARIYTLSSPSDSPAEAMVTEGNRILAIGTEESMRNLIGENDTMVDLHGYCVLPGFNDSHCHLVHTAVAAHKLNVNSACSPEEIVRRGRAYIEENHIPEGKWVHITGYNQNQFPDPVLPDGALANAISSRHPVLLERICGHVGAANPMAMQLAGITPETVIPGGAADVDENGVLTGVLRENALGIVSSCIPRPTREELKELLKSGSAEAASMGLTSLQSDDLGFGELSDYMDICKEMEEEDALSVRIWEEAQAPRIPLLQSLLDSGCRTDDGNIFKLGNIKLYADGSLGARTAYMRKPYLDTDTCGIAVYDQEELNDLISLAQKNGMQVAVHAIGDGALEQCLEAFEKAQEAYPANLRHRIVHCQIAGDDQLLRMKKLNLCADIQPPFVPTDAPIVEPLLGKERAVGSYRWKTMLDMGIPLGGGSDSPVESMAPLWGIQCAVTRQTVGIPAPDAWKPEEKLSLYEALCLYTKSGAYLSFEENEKGALLPGMLADFVVLKQDIFTAPEKEIGKIPVYMTVMDGKIRYKSE